MNTDKQQVHVIDDDEAVRNSIGMLLESEDLPCILYASGDEFLAQYDGTQKGCLLLDIRMSGLNGLELQSELGKVNSILPVIFMTGHGDLPMAVEAMRHGALDFIRKPVDEKILLSRIQEAFELESEIRKDSENYQDIRSLVKKLTLRERQVFDLVTEGKTNKEIAAILAISEKTVEAHRSKVMKKLNVSTLAQLVRIQDTS